MWPQRESWLLTDHYSGIDLLLRTEWQVFTRLPLALNKETSVSRDDGHIPALTSMWPTSSFLCLFIKDSHWQTRLPSIILPAFTLSSLLFTLCLCFPCSKTCFHSIQSPGHLDTLSILSEGMQLNPDIQSSLALVDTHHLSTCSAPSRSSSSWLSQSLARAQSHKCEESTGCS